MSKLFGLIRVFASRPFLLVALIALAAAFVAYVSFQSERIKFTEYREQSYQSRVESLEMRNRIEAFTNGRLEEARKRYEDTIEQKSKEIEELSRSLDAGDLGLYIGAVCPDNSGLPGSEADTGGVVGRPARLDRNSERSYTRHREAINQVDAMLDLCINELEIRSNLYDPGK